MSIPDHCTCVEHGPPSDPWRKPCTNPPKYRLVDEDGEGFLCNRHARAVRYMYEPGQLRKLRTPQATAKEPAR